MSESLAPRGATYRCPVCDAEITVLTGAPQSFRPVCCARPMDLLPGRKVFYWCEVCGAELMAVTQAAADFGPRCCNTQMVRLAT